MVANVVGDEAEPMIMLSGREVNPELASLIAGGDPYSESSTPDSYYESASSRLALSDAGGPEPAPDYLEEDVVSLLSDGEPTGGLGGALPVLPPAAGREGPPARHSFAVRGGAPRRLHHLDSDTSSLSALEHLRPVPTPEELLARPALNEFIDRYATARKEERRFTRHVRARRSMLLKLHALGRWLRLAREAAALRVLFDEVRHDVAHTDGLS